MNFACTVLATVLFILLSPWSSLALQEGADVTLTDLQVADAETLVSSPDGLDFEAVTSQEVHRGYIPTNLWFRFVIENQTDRQVNRLLTLNSPLMGKLTLWREGSNEILVSGPGVPLADRIYPTRLGNFSLTLQPNERIQYYLLSQTHHAVNTQLIVQTPRQEAVTESTSRAVFFFYFGGMVALVLYNLLLGIFTQEKSHLSYAFFAGSFGLTVLTLHGVLDTYLLPQRSFVFSNYLMFFSSMTGIAATLFVSQFLGIKKSFQWCYWGLRILAGLCLVTLIASFWVWKYRELYLLGYWIDLTLLTLTVFLVACGIYVWIKKKNPLALFFLLSWVIIFIGAFVWMGSVHGLLPGGVLTQYSLLFANLGEMVVLSLGLAYKIRILDTAKKRAERAAEEKDRYHRLVRVLSHDVGNTVSSIEYHTEMLKEKSESRAMDPHIDRITHSVEKLGEILNSVRQEEVLFSFKEHGKLNQVDLLDACREAMTNFDWRMQQKNMTADIAIPSSVYVMADRAALINQVLSNLISNSIKFSESGGRILFSVSLGETVVLSVCDFGTGIRSEDLPHLFKGKRLISHKGTGNEAGTGIGTSLVGEYMRLFGGDVRVESTHQSQGTSSGTSVHLYFKT